MADFPQTLYYGEGEIDNEGWNRDRRRLHTKVLEVSMFLGF